MHTAQSSWRSRSRPELTGLTQVLSGNHEKHCRRRFTMLVCRDKKSHPWRFLLCCLRLEQVDEFPIDCLLALFLKTGVHLVNLLLTHAPPSHQGHVYGLEVPRLPPKGIQSLPGPLSFPDRVLQPYVLDGLI